MNYIVLCISYLICWRICFSPTYHLAGFTYTLYSAMFLSIGIKYKIIIVSLVVLVDQLCIQVPSHLPDFCRVYYLEVYLGLEVYLLLSSCWYIYYCLGLEVYLLLYTWRYIQDWRYICYCIPGGMSRTGGLSIIVYLKVYLGLAGGLSIIVYLKVCLGLEVYLLLST